MENQSLPIFPSVRSRDNTSIPNENRSYAANAVAAFDSSKSTITPRKQALIRKVCRSPFVTPSHPLYVFGGSDSALDYQHEPSTPPPLRSSTSRDNDPGFEAKPPRQKRGKTCIESMNQMSLSSPSPSPFRTLGWSCAFDDSDAMNDVDEGEIPVQCQEEVEYQDYRHRVNFPTLTPLHHRLAPQQVSEPQSQNRILRKSTTFGTERMRRLSIDLALKHKLVVIEGDLEGEDGLSTRLRRMKRRLFQENTLCNSPKHHSMPSLLSPQVSYSSPTSSTTSSKKNTPEKTKNAAEAKPFSPAAKTPKHSNRSATKEVPPSEPEGMEVVLGNLPDESGQSFPLSPRQLSFSSLSPRALNYISSGNMIEDTPKRHKRSATDASINTESTMACSTYSSDERLYHSMGSFYYNSKDEDERTCDPNWVSFSSLSENIMAPISE